MISWLIKTEEDEDGDKETAIHAYKRTVKKPKSRALPRTLCDMTIHWKSNLEEEGQSFAPAFPPSENDKVCDDCKTKAAKAS